MYTVHCSSNLQISSFILWGFEITVPRSHRNTPQHKHEHNAQTYPCIIHIILHNILPFPPCFTAQVDNITDINMILLAAFSCKDILKISQEIEIFPKQETFL